MHVIQQKLLELAKTQNLADLTLRKTGALIGESGSPQKIKHHLDKLIEKGLLLVGADGKILKPTNNGFDKKTKLISLPIVGSANCGPATVCADQKVEGYLKISLGVLGNHLKNKVNNLFVLRATGNSMNRASVNGKNIEAGDFVIVEKEFGTPNNGDYVVSTIEGLANIKKFIFDQQNKQIILISESSFDLPPIYISKEDYSGYFISGKVVGVIKKPDEEKMWQVASCIDMEKFLPPLSKEEHDYYSNL
jgi:repressor LexA